MKEKTKTITSWHELIEMIESINPYKKTIVLNGWLNEMYGEHTRIRQLIFTTRDVNVLCNEDEKKTKKKKTSVQSKSKVVKKS